MKITIGKLRKTIRKIIVEVATPAEFTEVANLLISTDEDEVRKGIALGEQTGAIVAVKDKGTVQQRTALLQSFNITCTPEFHSFLSGKEGGKKYFQLGSAHTPITSLYDISHTGRNPDTVTLIVHAKDQEARPTRSRSRHSYES